MIYRGYIKLFRKIQDTPLYREKRRWSKNEAWIDLLLSAHHKDGEILVDLKRVSIKRGEVFTSQLGLSKKWNWGIASVNRFLKFLSKETFPELSSKSAENGKQISYRAERKYTIISILNWDKYQGEMETKRKAEWKTERKPNGNQTETVNNVEECKRIFTKVNRNTPNPNIDSLIDFLEEKNGLKNLDGSVKSNRQFANHCLNRFGLEETKKIIEIGSADKFHSQNLTNFRYLYYNAEKIKRSSQGKGIIKI
jgi:hypothetical protein